jgi:hypothetical protein
MTGKRMLIGFISLGLFSLLIIGTAGDAFSNDDLVNPHDKEAVTEVIPHPPRQLFPDLPAPSLKELNAIALAEIKKSSIRRASIVGIHHVSLAQPELFEHLLKPNKAVPPISITLPKTLTQTISVTIITDRVDLTDSRITWVGHLKDQPVSSVLLFGNAEARTISGEIRRRALVYEIKPGRNNSEVIFAIDERLLPPEHAAKWHEKVLWPKDLFSSVTFPPSRDPSVIDAMVLYTDKAIQADTSESIVDHVCRAVNQLQATLTNSGIDNIRIQLVHHQKIEFPESGRLENDLNNFRDESYPEREGIYNYHPLRSYHGADLVSLWVGDGDDCGRAETIPQPGGNGAIAFALVRRNCATTNVSFAHEMGHLMGTHHDRFDAQAADGPAANYGYLWTNIVEGWKTLMASDRTDCPKQVVTRPDGTTFEKPHCERLLHWSSPAGSMGGIPLGRPAGTPTSDCTNRNGDPTSEPSCDGPADNVRTLIANAAHVAKFTSTGIRGSSCDSWAPLPPRNLIIR